MDKSFVQNRYAIIRNAHNISARKLSFELGQSSEYINQIENGKSMPSIEGLFNFRDYFGITLAEFFDQTINYPIEFREIISELNKLDTIEIKTIHDVLVMINKNKNI